jgi:hypothetical protein
VRVVPEPETKAHDRAPFHRDGWIYEEKVDGWRSFVDSASVRREISATKMSENRRGLRTPSP